MPDGGWAPSPRGRAFTLIELLIVVAIIAILAAIAVPNFLEAQTRSKISRVRTDHRAIAVAIEAYTTDHNNPPPGDMVARDYLGITDYPEMEYWGYAFMTTPIAYIASVPLDPFATGRLEKPTPSQYTCFKVLKDLPSAGWTSANSRIAFGFGYTWCLSSDGPLYSAEGHATITFPDPIGQIRLCYDATNGTKSYGFILRTNKGESPTPVSQ